MAWALLSASSEPRVCEHWAEHHAVQLQLIADVAMTFRVTRETVSRSSAHFLLSGILFKLHSQSVWFNSTPKRPAEY